MRMKISPWWPRRAADCPALPEPHRVVDPALGRRAGAGAEAVA